MDLQFAAVGFGEFAEALGVAASRCVEESYL
jgi:hypothetical protein